MRRIVLASKSPRRREILEMLGWDFIVDSQETEEIFEEDKSIEENMQRIAMEKAKAICARHAKELILACDTMVVLDGKALGKPRDREEAKAMLRALSGKYSEVYSAVAIYSQEKEETFVEKTKIFFQDLSEEEIANYVATGEADDKAGAYAIQGKAAVFIRKIEGDYWSVVGLPITEIYQRLKEWPNAGN